MTEETAATRLERYRNAWRNAPGVVDSTAAFPDVERMETVWRWSDFVAQTCLRNPPLLAGLHGDGLLDRRRDSGEMACSVPMARPHVGAPDPLSMEKMITSAPTLRQVRGKISCSK